MAIFVRDFRTASMKARHEKLGFCQQFDCCELCRKPLKTAAVAVAIDHERYEFVTEAEAAERGDAVSLFDVGADCAKRIRRALIAA